MGWGNGPQRGGAMSPQAFWAPLDSPPPGTGRTGLCWWAWSSPTWASQADARRTHLLCHPDLATPCSSVSSPLWPLLPRVTPIPGLGRLQTGRRKGQPGSGACPVLGDRSRLLLPCCVSLEPRTLSSSREPRCLDSSWPRPSFQQTPVLGLSLSPFLGVWLRGPEGTC